MGPLLGCPRGALRVGGAMHCVTGGNTVQRLLWQTFVLSGLLGMGKQLQLRALMSIEGQNYVTDSVRYRLQHQPLDVVGCGVRN